MEDNFLLAFFALLTASVVLVPIAKFLGLGTVLGYLAAGILVGPMDWACSPTATPSARSPNSASS